MHGGSLFFFKRTLKVLYCKHPSINKLMAMKERLKDYSKGVMTVSNFSFFFFMIRHNCNRNKADYNYYSFYFMFANSQHNVW